MKIIFARRPKISSYLIRLFTWSKWSHVGIYDPKRGKVIEATYKGGVRATDLQRFIKRYGIDNIEFAKMQVIDSEEEAVNRAISQIGKKYDVGALFWFIFRKGWNSKDRWFCSELVAYSSGLFREKRVARISPEDNYKFSLPSSDIA